MSKMSIEWHEECLKNRIASRDEYRRRAAEAWDAAIQCSWRITTLADQIAEAKRRGLAAFDSDKFLVKRGGKR